MINYSVGLNHAGSFITAGRPWTKKISLTNGQEQVIQFPFVSKGIQVTKMSSSDPNGLLRVGFSSMLGGGSLPIQTRALDINGSTGFEKYSFTGANIVEYSISVWIKVDDLPTNSTDRKRIVELDVAGAQHSVQSYISGADTVFRLLLNGANASPIEASVAQNTGWIHLVVTTGSGSSILYVNGNPILTNANTVTNLNGIVIGGDAAGYTGVYDEMTLWDKKLSSLEVSELYNSANYYDPTSHSALSNLVSHWAFEDNANGSIYPSPDTTSTILDRVSTNNLSITDDDSSIDSIFTDAQSGWTEGGSAVTTSNSLSLKNDYSPLKIDCKTQTMYLYADGSDCEFCIFASLTNIPADRMYVLTGPGIDE